MFLQMLLNTNRLDQLIQHQLIDPANAYTPSNMLNDLQKGIFSELPANKPVDMYRRNLQKMYVESLTRLVGSTGKAMGGITIGAPVPSADKNNDMLSVVKAQVRTLAAKVKAAIATAPDTATREHLQDIYERLDGAIYKKD